MCLDVAGLAANLYRRNTPIIKVCELVCFSDLEMALLPGISLKFLCRCRQLSWQLWTLALVSRQPFNFHDKKNKLGTYSQPLAVFIDKAFLRTLDRRHLCNGAAEILKMACIKDEPLFTLLEAHGPEIIASGFQVALCSLLQSAPSGAR